MSEPRLRIGYIPYELFHIYWSICLQGAKTRAAELGITLVTPATSADDDIRAAVDELAQQRLDAVIVPGNLFVVDSYPYGAFNAAAIPAVLLEFEPDPAFVCAVHTNELQGAEMAVEELARRIGGGGKIAHLVGGPTKRYDALHAMLARRPQIELAFEAQGPWSREAGAQMMREALDAHADLSGVFAHNDQIALGAIDVIEERGYAGRIAVVGFDGTPEGLAAVHQGRMAATVYRSTYAVGRMGVEAAARAARGERIPPEIQTDTLLITAANVVEATLDAVALLPLIIADLLESKREQTKLQESIIRAQRSIIHELSTPIIPIGRQISVLPLIGSIDSARAQQIMETMLAAISRSRTEVLIIDITGVSVVDTNVANHLLQAARAAQLLGALVILVGVSPEVAQTVVQLGVDLSGIPTHSSVQPALEYARSILGDKQAR